MPPPRKQKQPDGTETKSDPCSYSFEDLQILARVLEEHRGKGAEGGFTKQAYRVAVNELNIAPTGGILKEYEGVKAKTAAMKKQWRQLKELKDRSGWGWNKAEQRPEASEEQWEQFLDAHPVPKGSYCPYKKYKTAGWPHFAAFDRAFNGSVATGSQVVRPWDRNAQDDDFAIDPDLEDEVGDESISSSITSGSWRVASASRTGAGGRRAASPDWPESSKTDNQSFKTPARGTQASQTNAQKSQMRKHFKSNRANDMDRLFTVLDRLADATVRRAEDLPLKRPETPRIDRKRRVFEDIDSMEFLSDLDKIKLYDKARKDHDMVETYLAVPGQAQKEGLLLHWAAQA